MNRRNVFLLVSLLVLVPLSSPAFGWGSATHAYMADHLGSNVRPFNIEEMYCATAPDLFQADLALAFDPLLNDYAHGTHGHEDFLAVWDEARSRLEKACGFGWASHNNVWGTDSTAHDPVHGYVIGKAEALDAALDHAGVWAQIQQQLGFPLPAEDRLLFCHIVVETDGDIVLRRADPKLAERLIRAGLLRSPGVPLLLADAMTGADPNVVKTMEGRFRQYLLLYGAMLSQDDETATRMLAADVARQALGYLAFAHPGLPIEPLRGRIEALALGAMQEAFPLLHDYVPAVQATIRSVADELADHHVADGKPGGFRGSKNEIPRPRRDVQ